jgi:hypothetical protein
MAKKKEIDIKQMKRDIKLLLRYSMEPFFDAGSKNGIRFISDNMFEKEKGSILTINHSYDKLMEDIKILEENLDK